MSRSRRIIVAGAAAAAAGLGVVTGALVAGGSDDQDDGDATDDDQARTVQPGAPGEESRELSDDEAGAIEPPEHSPVDTAFMQNMIFHHEQALEMAALVEERTERDDLPLLAERITVSQRAEIDLMEEWLTDRDEDVLDADDHAEHGLMPGMATGDEMERLETASGASFDRLFLDLMIAHHQGALTMVADLYADGGGLEPAADQFARDAEADQNIEIIRMQELLATLP